MSAPIQSEPSFFGPLAEAPLSSGRILRFAAAGFVLVVGLVLLAAFLGYQGSNRIQDTAQDLIREHLVASGRGAAIEASIVRQTQDLLDRLSWVLGLCFLLAAGTAGFTLWVLQRAFLRLEWQTAELSRVSWHLLDVHEHMAQRFSHEMHDELGQTLSALRRMLTRGPAAGPGSNRDECVVLVDEVIEDVRKLSQALRPVILDDLGLDSGLRWLAERFSDRTGIAVDVKSVLGVRLDSHWETHLFRIAQEALTNIARHSEATQATISLNLSAGLVRLEIADNGRGLPAVQADRPPSLGLVGMRARARQLGGELLIENRREGGLLVRAEVPFRQESPHADPQHPRPVG